MSNAARSVGRRPSSTKRAQRAASSRGGPDIEPERLVWLPAVSDGDWNIIANPMMENWPKVLLTTVTFTEEAGKTRMRLTWMPHQASDAEIACFAEAIGGLDKGWGKGMEMLAEILQELQE